MRAVKTDSLHTDSAYLVPDPIPNGCRLTHPGSPHFRSISAPSVANNTRDANKAMLDPTKCPHCNKQLRTERGVTQHIFQSPLCWQKQQEEVSEAARAARLATEAAEREKQRAQPSRRSARLLPRAEEAPDPQQFAARQVPQDVPVREAENAYLPPDDADDPAIPQKLPRKDSEQELSDDEEEEKSSNSDDAAANADDVPNNTGPNTEIRKKFRAYCDEHFDNFLPLTKEEKASIKLLHAMRKKAPLNAYQQIMEWHLKETGKLKDHEQLGDAEGYCHRTTLMKRLIPRYNLSDMMPIEKKVKLPSSKAVVSIPCRDAAECIVSLLTDPRFEDEDYLFFNDDPLAPPPENLTYLADLNTGDAYLKSYERMITHDKQVLLAVPLYIDGAVTGQFSDLPVTALKMSLGIHNREARDKQHAWRELGFVPVVRKDPARGKRIFQETGHLESQDITILEGEGDSNEEATDEEDADGLVDGAVKAQDFHTMLKAILESFVELQRTGFVWDLVHRGKVYRDIEFVIFVPFVKCDTEEADILCGKYTVRTQNVKHVCRYCHCPTDDADNPLAKYPLKTQSEIQNYVNNTRLDRLQAISQQYIQNAWYDVTFHAANDCGIHGATPSEKLHAIQLGIFKYLREIFFVHMGKSSQLAENINGLATMYGKLLTRQSERDLPNTNFAKGIQKGKLMARDFRGVLLIMAAVLRSKSGRKMLFKRKRFGGETGLKDWTLLVELMLEWEAYLGEKKMKRSHVRRLEKKHRFIMYIMKQVADRSSGMGLKVMKFHAIIHLISDIVLYGVPSEFDTGSNESHHKESKSAAKLTQRKESSFNFQTAKRLLEFLAIDLGMEEIVTDRCVWEYFQGAIDADVAEILDAAMDAADAVDPPLDITMEDVVDDLDALSADQDGNDTDLEENDLVVLTGGTRIKVYEEVDDATNQVTAMFEMLSRSSTQQDTVWSQEVVDFLNGLQNLVIGHIPELCLPIMTQHRRGSQTFYGHPNFRSSGPWKDWALVDWGTGWGILPSHIWCFIELRNMPKGNQKLEYGGITLQDGVYAVVEVAEYVEDEDAAAQSDLFIPLNLEVKAIDEDGDVEGRQFYLANTEAFVGPCCVVPDIGGPNNAYFQVKPRREWSDMFVTWLKEPHNQDVMLLSDEEKDDGDSD